MDALVSFLITICIIAAIFYLVIWVLGQIGVPLPVQVIKILWVIFALIVLLALYHVLVGASGWPRIRIG